MEPYTQTISILSSVFIFLIILSVIIHLVVEVLYRIAECIVKKIKKYRETKK